MLNQKNACLIHATYRCTCNLCQAEQDEQKMGLAATSSAAEQQLFLHHLPRLQRSVFNHCQPLQPTALTSIAHFIMSHHNSRRLAGSALLGVPWRCSATSMLASLDVHRSQRCSQDSQRWQPQRAAAAGAGGRAMGWTTPPHHTILVLEGGR